MKVQRKNANYSINDKEIRTEKNCHKLLDYFTDLYTNVFENLDGMKISWEILFTKIGPLAIESLNASMFTEKNRES